MVWGRLLMARLLGWVTDIFINTAKLPLKQVPLNQFMQDQLGATIALTIPVPSHYEWADLPDSPFTYAYWMRPQDALASAASDDLPAEHGYMYGKISLDVGYDAASDCFVGAEDEAAMRRLRADFVGVRVQRLQAGEHPLLLLEMRHRKTGKHIFALYLAMGIDSNVVYVALRPAGNSRKLGRHVWKRLEENLGKLSVSTSLH